MVPLSLKKMIDKSSAGREDRIPGLDLSEEYVDKAILKGNGGYDIVLDKAIPEGANRIVVAMHGICGSKASRFITLLQRVETGKGIGLVKFDWPAHGRSRAKDSDLTIANCLSDLETVTGHLKKKYPGVDLIAVGTSFGGYITMLYHADHPDDFKKIILRSPGLRFGWLLRERILDDDLRRQIEEEGHFTIGFDRMMDVPKALIDEADDNRIEDIYDDPEKWDLKKVTIVHGDADELVPYEDSVAFAEKHDIVLHRVEGADHFYSGEGLLEEAVAIVAEEIDREMIKE